MDGEPGDSDRYVGRPLLKLLDAWVLDAIGELDEGTAGQLESHGGRIARSLGADDASATWQDAVIWLMRMPADADAAARRLWDELRSDAILTGTGGPDALAFARELVNARMRVAS